MENENRFRHPLSEGTIRRIVEEVRRAWQSGKTQEEIAEACGTTQKHIHSIIKGKTLNKFTIDMALMLWTGLGHRPETLIPGDLIDYEKLEQIASGEYAELLADFVELLAAAKPNNKDIWKMAGVISYLKNNPGLQ
jgi:plasmid maintenance system antidote protein VapI